MCHRCPSANQGILQPSESSVRVAGTGNEPRVLLVDGGDEVVHVLKAFGLGHFADHRLKSEPPSVAREGIFRADQRHRLSPDLGCGDRLGLPGLELQGLARLRQLLWVYMLKVIESSAAPHLESSDR